MPNGWSQNEISGACIYYSAALSNIQKYEITIAIATERGGFKIECNIGRPGFPGSSNGQESTCNAENLGSIPGSGRSPGEGSGNPLQYSCLEDPMDREAW